MEIIIKPVLTEKMTALTDKQRKVAFIVAKEANKIEIKKAVEEIFGVTVEKVTTANYQGKKKRTGRYPEGTTPAYKKAVVKLTAGSKTIEFFEGMA